MDLVKVYVLILLGVDLLLSRTDGDRLCSCYTFSENKWSWTDARNSCKANNKILAVMESEQEWQFITNEIQNKTGNPDNEWFIGLEKNSTTNRWTWINGKSVTIDKWSDAGIQVNPDPADSYGMIHKEYPDGFKGSFSTFKDSVYRGWICEEETATCQGICFVHPILTSTSPSGTSTETKAVTTQDEESAPPKKSAPKSSEKDQLGESQYASVNPVEAAKLLGSANTTPDMSENSREPPPENCEYAVVNKANKKRKEADLVYAQLAEFDHETDSAKPPKPPSYEPTVYADVEEMPPELPGREDPDCSQPTYANLETTGV